MIKISFDIDGFFISIIQRGDKYKYRSTKLVHFFLSSTVFDILFRWIKKRANTNRNFDVTIQYLLIFPGLAACLLSWFFPDFLKLSWFSWFRLKILILSWFFLNHRYREIFWRFYNLLNIFRRFLIEIPIIMVVKYIFVDMERLFSSRIFGYLFLSFFPN